MFTYYKTVAATTEAVSDKYIQLNNCGFNDSLCDMEIVRKEGRLDYQLIYVKSGELTIRRDGEDLVLRGGSIYLYRPSVPQLYGIYGTPTTFFWIHFTGKGIEEMLSFFTEEHYYIGHFAEIERYCSPEIEEHIGSKKYKDMFLEGNLISLFAILASKISEEGRQKTERSIILPALRIINASPEKRLSNDQLARICNLNRYYFIKTFKSSTGCTPQQYYIRLIIDKSKYLLENTRYNISEIAQLCGIEDSLYFSRLFKKHTGVSPMNYRKEFL